MPEEKDYVYECMWCDKPTTDNIYFCSPECAEKFEQAEYISVREQQYGE